MPIRRLAATAVAALALLAAVPSPPASASSVPLNATIAPAWAKGAVTIVRTGWTVNVSGTLTDSRADGDCVYVEAVLQVDDWTDPDGRTPDHCGGKGTSRPIGISLHPSAGSRLASIRVRVCAADAFADSCSEKTYAVPAERAAQPGRKAAVDSYRSMSISSFLAAKRQAPAPYNWNDDGCSNSPDKPGGFNFLPACQRHDFGYRNYGHGSVKASPSDATRAAVDSRLKADLTKECGRYSGDQRSSCLSYADTYYAAVRTAGGKAFYG
ncbi:hypothetical protein BH10ACT1_BH10ACT1_10380 [soil metagenome]